MHLSKGIGRQGRSGSTSGTPKVIIFKQEVLSKSCECCI
jgi:hypothetical protein